MQAQNNQGEAKCILRQKRYKGKVLSTLPAYTDCRVSIGFKSELIQQPRFCPPRFCLLWKAIISRLADKFGIPQTFSEYSANDFYEPSSVIVFALIEPKRLLIQISEQMKRLNADIRPLNSPLKQRPEVFQSVRVNVAFRVAFGVVDHVVNVFFFLGRNYEASASV